MFELCIILLLLVFILFVWIALLYFWAPCKTGKQVEKVRRSVFVVNKVEADGNFISTLRSPDSGKPINIVDMDNKTFGRNVFIYVGGMMCSNDVKPASNMSKIKNDVARKTNEPWKLIFAQKLDEGDVIQIVIF